MAESQFQPEVLPKAPLRYAPVNELGVVFLFAHLCHQMQLRIESVQAAFPDCIAWQRVGGKERRIRIEFEYRSRNFRSHGHSADDCDWIVCWEDDWPNAPSNLTIVELRDFFSEGFKVWCVMSPPNAKWPARANVWLRKRASRGDLLLRYEWAPAMCFRDVFQVVGPVEPAPRPPDADGIAAPAVQQRRRRSRWAPPPDGGRAPTSTRTAGRCTGYAHRVRRVCTLVKPLSRHVLTGDSMITINPMKKFQNITECWWRIYELMLRGNPECAAALNEFAPSLV